MAESMTNPQEQELVKPNPALKALDVMVGTWDLKGRDFTQPVTRIIERQYSCKV